MKARRNSKCAFCPVEIKEGEDISTRMGKWGHTVCPVEASPIPITRPVHEWQLAASYNPIVEPTTANRDVETWKHDCDILGPAAALDVNESCMCGARPPMDLPEWFKPSSYQTDIFEFIRFGEGNAMVEAVAGSGKTTTIVMALRFTPPTAQVAFVAFNAHIAKELKSRAPDHVHVSTLHSLGFTNLKDRFPKLRRRDAVNANKLLNYLDGVLPMPERGAPQEERTAAWTARANMQKLVGLAKATLVDETNRAAIEQMIEHYGIDLGDDHERLVELLPGAIQWCVDNMDEVDFDDMLWLPVRLNLSLRKYDWLFVDEAQDLNANQVQFVLRSIAPNGRVICVGDRRQSLYGFRGADVQAVPNLIVALNATVLPLSITYRCPSSHVKLAQEIVPGIEAAATAREGTVETITPGEFAKRVKPGQMVVCRVNAPLVGYAFALIKQGVKAVVRGRDIGANLASLARKMANQGAQLQAKDGNNVDDQGGPGPMDYMEKALWAYRQNELIKLDRKNASETQRQALEDRVQVLETVMGECQLPDQVAAMIEGLFSDEIEGVILSSVHRAKGLECETVYILRPDLMPFKKVKQEWELEQEWNIRYVALTRSKDSLVFVQEA